MAPEIIVTIGTDGKVTIQVRGAPGRTCLALTEELERALGAVRARKMDPRAIAGTTAMEVEALERLQRKTFCG